ncbi:MAG: hypothetical protein U5O39_15260 [Gammaproteobacteria bacterium]|nr:hypothetical protein [Gammaproteobacteria bacterium]
MTYTNNITNTGQGPALSNDDYEYARTVPGAGADRVGGNWTAVNTLDSPYTVNTEAFDDGADTFTYDPTTFCGAATPGNSPCYDPAIEAFEIELNENVPVGNNFEQSYRAQIE